MTRQMNNLSLFKHKKAVHDGYIRDNKKTNWSVIHHIWFLIKIIFEVITTSEKIYHRKPSRSIIKKYQFKNREIGSVSQNIHYTCKTIVYGKYLKFLK